MSAIVAGNAGMSRRRARNICEVHADNAGGSTSLVVACWAARVLYTCIENKRHCVRYFLGVILYNDMLASHGLPLIHIL